nr:docking protein 2 isoform X1 [Oryctolagus cuniculus]
MEAVAVKQGCLYLQQHQAFAKKWRRFGAVLYAESGCALARLELQEGPEKTRRGDAGRRVIRLSDCLRVAEAGSEASSPRDTSAFLLETKERLYLLAAPTAERSDWLQAICLLAFPRKELQVPEGKSGQPHMEINELYSRATVVPCKEFAVTMRPTEASERCRLRGSYILRAGENALELWGGSEPGTPLFHWPYRFLRRFGRDKVTFSFEAGRRCLSGEGSFEFETRQGNEIFSALEEAISAQKNAGPAPAAARPESPYAQPLDSLPSPPPAAPLPAPRTRAPEGDYAVPFDAVARRRGHSLARPLPPPDPLYDSIEEQPPAGPDPIYDEPEGVAALTLYDSPQGPGAEAWGRRERPASGWPPAAEYDNVVLRKGPK